MTVQLLLAGGGLANGLIAYRLRQRIPELRVALVEGGPRLGGEHTWSFYDADLSPDQRKWVAPLVEKRWPDYEVRFPGYKRILKMGYNSLNSSWFHEVVSAALGPEVHTSAQIVELSHNQAILKSGERFETDMVLDGRGVTQDPHLDLGFQKFLGMEFQTEGPHGQTRPIIMDASISQEDGYRFIYTLPFADDRLLIEDTYFSDGSNLDPSRLRREIEDYAKGQGWRVKSVLREESGVLPLTLGGDIAAFWDAKKGIASSGLSAALFHPVTGYSFPNAVRLADKIADYFETEKNPTAFGLFELTRRHSEDVWRSQGYFRLLNRMLFRAAAPDQRVKVLSRFYRLPSPLIARFYAGRLTLGDKSRILIGKPPVPIGKALGCLFE